MLTVVAALVLLAVTAAPILAPAGAEFVPLGPGREWVWDWRNESTIAFGNRPPVQQTKRGKASLRVEGKETKNGREYWKLVGRNEALPELGAGLVYWRIAPDGWYTAGEVQGLLKEYLLLPFPPTVGRTWDYDDGLPSRARIARVTSLDLPAGRFDECLLVVRDFQKAEHRAELVSETYYCRGVGEAKSVFRHSKAGPAQRSETVRTLLSIRGAP